MVVDLIYLSVFFQLLLGLEENQTADINRLKVMPTQTSALKNIDQYPEQLKGVLLQLRSLILEGVEQQNNPTAVLPIL